MLFNITLYVFLGALLLSSALSFFLDKKGQMLPLISESLIIALIVISGLFAIYHPENLSYSFFFHQFNHIQLNFAIQFDALTKIMLIFILVITWFIYHYAKNYLESDNTRMRFLAQLNLVLLSVILLVTANNLFTAFIAWQFIGINLYLLLNHYHYDHAANRAAKKKFVINRLGDCTFLLAIILAYQTHSADSFSALQHSSQAGLICTLIFISVMTKCAQFPFHIWLIDTMETPTPVSALMHAGVINAGGILLTRISATLTQFHGLVYFILTIGLISALLSIRWMNQQPDTKKKLAYSTMGQMGYMLTQCSLGAFPAAVFHLISHGFYKASLFLNAGETLTTEPAKKTQITIVHLSTGIIISVIILAIGIFCFQASLPQLPLLIYGFMGFTLINLTVKLTSQNSGVRNLIALCTLYLLTGIVFWIYLALFSLFSSALRQYEFSGIISNNLQLAILALVALAQLAIWYYQNYGDAQNKLVYRPDRTEFYLRRYLLNPLRSVGNLINHTGYKTALAIGYPIILIIMVAGFGYFVQQYFAHELLSTDRVINQLIINTAANQILTGFLLAIGVVILVIANRCLTIRGLLLCLVLFELIFTNIALVDIIDNAQFNLTRIGLFHFVNISTVIIMLILLTAPKKQLTINLHNNNKFPARVFYFVFSLLLLIGIPGTASFISEFYLFSAIIQSNLAFIMMYMGIIILISIVIMHSLQLYAFNKQYGDLLRKPIPVYEHVIFLMIIGLNIVCGIWPDLLLSHF